MRSRTLCLIVTLVLGLLAAPLPADAQQAGKIPRIGYLGYVKAFREAFRQGLRDHGYRVGENVIIERRSSRGKGERLVDLVTELVRLPVDLIVAPGTRPALAARQVTSTIPIVTVFVANPVEIGLADSLAHPGKNVTGINLVRPRLAAVITTAIIMVAAL